jgi:nucleoside-diphosphate-sugar epimerase
MVAKKFGNRDKKVVFDIPENEKVFGYAPSVKMKLCSDKLRALGWEPTHSLEEMYKCLIESFIYQMNGCVYHNVEVGLI